MVCGGMPRYGRRLGPARRRGALGADPRPGSGAERRGGAGVDRLLRAGG